MVRDLNKDGDFSENEVFYYTRDHLGSVRELLDHRGVMYQRYSYGAYGETRLEKHEGSQKHKFIENRYAYTSREVDHKTSLYYYRARWYSPQTGSFISADPIGFSGQDTNFYRYVGNNPVLLIDPFGLAVLCTRALDILIFGRWGFRGGENPWFEGDMEFSHPQFFYDDIDNDNISYFKDGGIREDTGYQRSDYVCHDDRVYDDNTLRRAVDRVRRSRKYREDNYDFLKHNCHHFVNDVLEQYYQLQEGSR